MEHNLESYIMQYKNSDLSEFERARLEALMWQSVSAEERRTTLFKHRGQSEYISKILGVSEYEVAARRFLYLGGASSQTLWNSISNDKMPLAAARRILREAKNFKIDDRQTIESLIADKIAEYKKLDPYFNKDTGRIHRRQKPVGNIQRKDEFKIVKTKTRKRKGNSNKSHDLWKDIRATITKLVSSQLKEVDDSVADLLRNELEGDLRSLIDSFGPKIKRAKENGSAREIGRKITRTKLLEACSTLVMNPPKPGKEVDLILAKKRYRSRAALFHPDKRGAHAETLPEWHALNEAFNFVNDYNDQLKEEKIK